MGLKFQHIKKNNNSQKEGLFDFLNKDIALFGPSFSNKKKESFYSELSVLLKSGVSLKNSLDIISESQSKGKDIKFFNQLTKKIVEGESLSEAIKDNKSFLPYEYHALFIGDQTGQQRQITNDLYEFFKNKNLQKRQLIGSLTYPVIVLLTALGVTFFMLKFVVPVFESTFKQNGVELPWITRVVISFSNGIEDYGWLLFIFLLGLIFLFLKIKNKLWYKRFIGKFQLRIPIFGGYIKKIYIVQFTHAMSLLTRAKIPVVNGLGLVKNMISFFPLSSSIERVEILIISGDKLHDSFKSQAIFDKKLIALLKVAEETNQTEFIFQKLYEQYSADIKHQSDIISNVLNTLLTFLVALIVGVILISMYLPMFKLSSVIG